MVQVSMLWWEVRIDFKEKGREDKGYAHMEELRARRPLVAFGRG